MNEPNSLCLDRFSFNASFYVEYTKAVWRFFKHFHACIVCLFQKYLVPKNLTLIVHPFLFSCFTCPENSTQLQPTTIVLLLG